MKGNYSKKFIERIRKFLVDQQVQVRITRKNTQKFPLAVIMHLTNNNIDVGHKGNIARYVFK